MNRSYRSGISGRHHLLAMCSTQHSGACIIAHLWNARAFVQYSRMHSSRYGRPSQRPISILEFDQCLSSFRSRIHASLPSPIHILVCAGVRPRILDLPFPLPCPRGSRALRHLEATVPLHCLSIGPALSTMASSSLLPQYATPSIRLYPAHPISRHLGPAMLHRLATVAARSPRRRRRRARRPYPRFKRRLVLPARSRRHRCR